MLNKILVKILVIVLFMASFLSTSCLFKLAGALEKILYFFVKLGCINKLQQKYHVARVNLKLCFPDYTTKQIDRLLHSNFREAITAILHYGYVISRSKQSLTKKVKVKNVEAISKYYKNRPIIVVAPHFWGLDLGALRMSIDFSAVSIMHDEITSPLRQILKKSRLRFMIDRDGEVLGQKEGIGGLVRKLRKKKISFYYLPDIDVGEEHSVYVPFFAHTETATLGTLAKLVQLTDAVVVSMLTYRDSDGYVVEFSDRWLDSALIDSNSSAITMNSSVEVLIKRFPNQYMWDLKRFGTQPNLKYGTLYE